MGFKQLQRDVAALQQRGQGVVRLELEDSVVRCSFAACRAPISVVFCQPDDYDSSPVLVMCESCAKVSAQLQQVSDTFEDGGALLTILQLVCQALKIGALLLCGVHLVLVLSSGCTLRITRASRADEAWLQGGEEEEEGYQSMSRDGSRAGTDADCASPRSSAGGDDCWDMAEGDNDAQTKVVMQKLSRCVFYTLRFQNHLQSNCPNVQAPALATCSPDQAAQALALWVRLVRPHACASAVKNCRSSLLARARRTWCAGGNAPRRSGSGPRRRHAARAVRPKPAQARRPCQPTPR